MGTTGTAIAGDDGFDYQVVVLVEGYAPAITDGPTAAVVTALSGTEFTSAIGGLSVNWDLEQQLDPWAPEPDVSSLSFSVMDVNADEFGIAVFGTSRGASTFLNGDIDCNDTTVTVLSTAAFASSGTIHIDTEAITYSGVTATTFTGCTRGRYSPLKASSEAALRFGKPHANGTISGGVTLPTRVTSVQSTWVGRSVAIYLLRRTGSVLDVIAQGHRVWAGRIAGTRDEANGLTVVECEDGRSWFRDCVLLRDQWRARIADGIYLRAGVRFDAWDAKAAARLDANGSFGLLVTTGASGDYQMEAGITTLQALSNALNNWLLQAKVAGKLNTFWRFDPQISTDAGSRSRFSWSGGSSTDVTRVYIKCSDPHVWNFLGWGMVDFVREDWEDSATFEEISPGPPHRVYMHGSYGTMPVIDELGTFWDNQPYAPADGGILATSTGTWGYIQFDDGVIAVAEKNGTNILPKVSYGRSFLNAIAGANSTSADVQAFLLAKRTVDEEGDIRVKQVAIIEGTMTTLLTRFLASTGTSTYNGTYDVFPEQLGAAMPWAVLGTGWTASTDNLAEGQANQIVVIEKPTRLVDKFGGELAARLASVQWKDEGYQAVTWATPNAITYEHSFDEQDKFASDKERQAMATVANETDKFLCTLLKVEYNRVLSGGYKSTDMIHDAGAARSVGKEKARTISLPNIYGPPVGGGTGSLEALLDGLKAIVPLFSKPLRMLRRKIGLNHFEGVAPGDQCLISDNHARDPATGERGLTNKPGIIMGVRVDWGGHEIDGGTREADGEVDIVISPRDRVSRYSPCAEVDFGAANAGYNAGTRTLTTRAHQHSNSGAAVDASRFAANDEVVIVEIDPDTAASASSWQRIVQSVSGNDIVLTVALSSPAWDTAKRYRIISNTYVNATATQQADVYQADDADGLINDAEQPYEYGYNAGGANTWAADSSIQYGRLHATSAYGDAVPLDTGYEQDIAKLANALCWGRTAICMPYLTRSVMGYVDAGIIRQILAVIPIHLGPAKQFSDVRKWLNVKPWLRRATAGASVNMLVSLCRHPPAGSSKSITDADAPEYVLVGPYETATWSTGSATWALGDVHQFDTKMVDPYNGEGFIVIEGESNLETRGLPQCATSLPDLT